MPPICTAITIPHARTRRRLADHDGGGQFRAVTRPSSPAPSAADRPDDLLPALYDELRALAAREMRREATGHTLQPTALVHEAYLRLVGGAPATWESRAHFLNLAAQVMRRILVEHARGRGRHKRGGDRLRVTLDEQFAAGDTQADLTDIDEALERLASLDARKAKVVELRFFAGLSVEETAKVLAVSEPTVKRDWQFAKAWIQRELQP